MDSCSATMNEINRLELLQSKSSSLSNLIWLALLHRLRPRNFSLLQHNTAQLPSEWDNGNDQLLSTAAHSKACLDRALQKLPFVCLSWDFFIDMSHPKYFSDLQSKQSEWEMSISYGEVDSESSWEKIFTELFKESSVLFWTEICLTLENWKKKSEWIWTLIIVLSSELNECLELDFFFFCRSDIEKQLQQLLFPWKQNDRLLHSIPFQAKAAAPVWFLHVSWSRVSPRALNRIVCSNKGEMSHCS